MHFMSADFCGAKLILQPWLLLLLFRSMASVSG